MEIRLLWEIFRDRYKILVTAVLLCLIVAIALIIIYPRVYQCSAHFQARKTSESALFISGLPKEISAYSYFDVDTVLGSLELFMKNDLLIQRVIDKCDLKDKVKFAPEKFADPGLFSIAFSKKWEKSGSAGCRPSRSEHAQAFGNKWGDGVSGR